MNIRLYLIAESGVSEMLVGLEELPDSDLEVSGSFVLDTIKRVWFEENACEERLRVDRCEQEVDDSAAFFNELLATKGRRL